jgi:hypothetical protein
MIALGSFLASHKSKIFLAMRGTTAPLQTLHTEEGTSLFTQTPDVSFGWGGGAEKVLTIFATLLKRKHVFGAQIGYFFTI